jgi:epoxyqueuosine reductase
MSQASSPIPFATVASLCAAEGLRALAVLAPVPPAGSAGSIERMLADGVGDLAWLGEDRHLRDDPAALLPSARAILVTALAYQPEAGCGELKRARYAAGKDYHHLLRPRLARIGDALAAAHGATWRSRATVDSAPINERALAHLAGLGWLGRNGLLISPSAGSYRLLGTLLTEAPLAAHHGGEDGERCGSCTACEKRCPTGALQGRRVLTERCISYLTIEHRGVIPRALAARFEGWWFGCDLCQEACPWNRFAPPADDPRLRGDERDAELLAVTAASFDTHFAGRAVRRTGYERFRRNLLVACWSLARDTAPFIAEGLPLVLAQARELGLAIAAPDGGR